MKRDIVLSAIISLAFHVSVLSAHLPKSSSTGWDAHAPVSLSIIRSKKVVPAPSPRKSPSETGLKSDLLPKRRAVRKRILVSRSTRSPKKDLTAKPAPKQKSASVNRLKDLMKHAPEPCPAGRDEAAGEPSIDHVSKTPDEMIGTGSSFETASIPKGAITGEREIVGTLKGNGSEKGILTYATPKYKENPPPNYPKVARRRGYEGSTRLKVEVLESGKVGRIEIASSSGFEVLDKAALESVKNWTFTPGTRSGENIRQWVMVPVRFSLR
ncbi:MAG: energy transducer TonB [Proteobacteria bacterium]|nr:energy transducer TonB [Pseudomonadota bacterium]